MWGIEKEDILAKKAEENIKQDENKLHMYIGPTIEKVGLNHGAVINGNPKVLYGKIIKEIPEIEKMLIPVDQNISIKKRNINLTATLENIYYNKIKEKLLGGK